MNTNNFIVKSQLERVDLSAKIYHKKPEANTDITEQKIEITQPESNVTNTNIIASHLGLILLAYVIAMIVGIAFVKIWINRKNEQKQTVQFWRYLNQVPCKKCQFFAENNPYLKCAVNPFTVLTKEAFDCSDFCPKSKK